MNNISKFLTAAGALALVVLFLAWAPQGEDQQATTIYRAVKTGTITDTGADTFAIVPNLASLWAYSYVVSATQTSGTTNITVRLQESNETTGNIWYEVERDTVKTGGQGLIVRLDGSKAAAGGYVRGQRQRVILTGTTGTQVSPFHTTVVLKKAN
jgi:hypothetical protein